MSIINPGLRNKTHTAEFIIRVGNGFISDSVRVDKLACPMEFMGENNVEDWIIDQCQKHLGKDVNVCYKNFRIKILIDVEPYDEDIKVLKKAQEELWDGLVKKKIKMKRPTYGYMKDDRYVELKEE